MSYNQFKKVTQLRETLGLRDIAESWLPKSILSYTQISIFLDQLLKEAIEEPLATKKARSESIVAPILKELKRNQPNRFSCFSGFQFDVYKSKGLLGYCDFILSAETKQLEITAPIFCLVEAKDDRIERGLAQCGAEMYAAQIFNEREGNPKKQIFGCVTNAFSWCFLKLENNKLYIDPNYVPLTFTEPHRVLAVLQWILDESLKPNQ